MLRTRFSRRQRRLARVTPELRTNHSFVLHERSDSAAVERTALLATAHAARLWRVPAALPLIEERTLPPEIDCVLTAQMGLPARLAAIVGSGPRLRFIDHLGEQAEEVTFFRAAARLALPQLPGRVVVAAVVLRPGGRSAHLVVAGPFDWPGQRDAVIAALERLLQRFIDQWFPCDALWSAPAEVLLAGEVE